jgi:hypothetical protein
MIYDTSVVVKCINYMRGKKPPEGDKAACDVIFSDDHCIIPPTAYRELKQNPRAELKAIEDHCTVYTDDMPPFSERLTEKYLGKELVDEFADYIRLEWINRTPSGHSEKAWLKREFNREVWRNNQPRKRCHGSGKFEHRINDYRILKEANILAEAGIDDTLASADWAHTDPVCQHIYDRIMEEFLPSDLRDSELREDLVVNVCFYKHC